MSIDISDRTHNPSELSAFGHSLQLSHHARDAPLLEQAIGSPFVIRLHQLREVGLRLAGPDERLGFVAQNFHTIAVCLHACFVAHWAVAGHDFIEIERIHDGVERLCPFNQAAAAVVIDQRGGCRSRGERVA